MSNTSASETGLRRVDAGWLYLLAGAVLVASMVLIAPADDLEQIRYRRDRLSALESDAVAKLQGYETFLEAIDEADPMLVRRLAAAQLNLVPESSKPIGLIGVELDAHVDHWIRETLPPPALVDPPVVKDSWLRRLASGPTRLWAILAGAILIFIGLLPQAEESTTSSQDGDGETIESDPQLAIAEFALDELDEPVETEQPEMDEFTEDGDEDDGFDEDEEVEEADDQAGILPASQPRLVVSESGDLLLADGSRGDDEPEPLVQVVTISASSAN